MIIDADGVIRYMNPQAAGIFLGPGAQADRVINRPIDEVFPELWVKERRAFMDEIERTGEHRIIRTIWLGLQVFSCIKGIAAKDVACGKRFDRFIVISRRCRGNPMAGMPLSRSEQVIESKVASLGPLDQLSERELEVLALIGNGLSAKEIASRLHRSVRTIEGHRLMIGRKLHTDDRLQLARMASRAGLSTRDTTRVRVRTRKDAR